MKTLRNNRRANCAVIGRKLGKTAKQVSEGRLLALQLLKDAMELKDPIQRERQQTVLLNNFADLMPEWRV